MSDQAYSREHDQCVFETQIATKLREASRTERMKLYGQLTMLTPRPSPSSVPGGTHDADQTVGFELAFARNTCQRTQWWPR